MIEFLEWLFKTHPELATAIVCLGAFLFVVFMGIKRGMVSIGRPRRSGSDRPEPGNDSGRLRAVRTLDLFEEHELEMPDHWQAFVDERARHKTANLLQAEVLPLIQREKARIDRIEPVVAELKAESRQTHDSVVRLEAKVEGVKDSVAKIEEGVEGLRDTIAKNGERTHEMLGAILGRKP